MIPFFNRVDQVAGCLDALLLQGGEFTDFLLVDDASTEPLLRLEPYLQRDNVQLIQHEENQGVAAARNSALAWCRERPYSLIIMIDSDCVPSARFVESHIELHREYPDAACIGAGVVGMGKSYWARLDGIASWVHSAPHKSTHEVAHPYHLPTTNFSVKCASLPDRAFIFDERLYTGEDCLLIREYRRRGQTVLFSPEPVIYHRDRERLADVIRHHYRWGHHQYFIQLGRDISPYVFNPLYRAVFLLLFIPVWPLFSLAGAALNLFPWLSIRVLNLGYFPGVFGLWLCKGLAVVEAAVRPAAVLRRQRRVIVYQQIGH